MYLIARYAKLDIGQNILVRRLQKSEIELGSERSYRINKQRS